jgi:hypothetical protein
MPAGRPVTLRLTIADPMPGLRYSLQDAGNRPVSPQTASGAPLSFDAPVRYDGGRWLGDFVRREGSVRRFVYIALGRLAGDEASPVAGRAKIDIHDIPPALVEAAGEGVIEVRLPGVGRNGGPAVATLRPLEPWKIVR